MIRCLYIVYSCKTDQSCSDKIKPQIRIKRLARDYTCMHIMYKTES